MESEKVVWEAQTGESSVAYEAFCAYRNLEPSNRSQAEVAKKLGKSTVLMSRWSARYNWVSRALAWDIEEDRKFRTDIGIKRRKAAVRQIQASALAQAKVAEFLMSLQGAEMTATEAARWYEVAVKVERQALGEPDRVQITNIDGVEGVEDMSPEQVLGQLKLMAREIEEALGVQSESVSTKDDGEAE